MKIAELSEFFFSTFIDFGALYCYEVNRFKGTMFLNWETQRTSIQAPYFTDEGSKI